MKFGLENISRLCAALDHPERAFASIIVAGTNGKGSVTAMVHRGLRAAGHRAARYTSPHLERLEERFVIDDQEVGTDALRQGIDRVRGAIERLQQSAALDAPPTFFECATAVAFDLFREAGVRIAVLEVGLGGRLDATNVVQPLLAAITSIGLDHQAQLGNTLESVAFEKAGVVKPRIPVVVGDLPVEAQRVVEQVCREREAELIRASTCGPSAALARTTPLALAGRHQQHNAQVAACVLGQIDRLGFPISASAIATALSDVQWPGRLERFSVGGTEFLLDAAHNPDGAAALAEALKAELGERPVVACLAILGDKDAAGIVRALASAISAAIVTEIPPGRLEGAGRPGTSSTPMIELGQLCEAADLPTEGILDPSEAIAWTLERAREENGVALVAGSHYLLSY